MHKIIMPQMVNNWSSGGKIFIMSTIIILPFEKTRNLFKLEFYLGSWDFVLKRFSFAELVFVFWSFGSILLVYLLKAYFCMK